MIITNSKQCTVCTSVKITKNFRENRNVCRSCEKYSYKQRYSGDRTCTNCHIFKLEVEFDKFSPRCKICKSNASRNKIIKLKNNPNQSEYISHLKRHSENNTKRYKKTEAMFDAIPIEKCYVKFLGVLRKNANSRSKKLKIDCDIDLPFLIDLYNEQNGKCALTGIYFNLTKFGNTKRAFAPSIDRINCNAGYTKNNIRIVCLIVNLALNDFGDSAFDIMCKSYVKRWRPTIT